jgi:hypothetical protein
MEYIQNENSKLVKNLWVVSIININTFLFLFKEYININIFPCLDLRLILVYSYQRSTLFCFEYHSENHRIETRCFIKLKSRLMCLLLSSLQFFYNKANYFIIFLFSFKLNEPILIILFTKKSHTLSYILKNIYINIYINSII